MIIGILIAGMAFGLLMGALITRNHIESRMDEKEQLIDEMHQLIMLQKKYIEQEDKEMTIPERARRYERHWHLVNRFEMMTDKGLLVVKIFNRDGHSVRITYKNGEAVDIQKVTAQKENNIKFGGF